MQAIGICRFSYPAIGGFQVRHDTIEDRIAYLYADARLEERFALFETIALPGLRAQSDPDFSLIVVIGDQLPQKHRKRLHDLVADVPQVLVHKEPPRKQREVMKEVLNAARLNPAEPCLQFRFDDDDAVAVDFIAKLRQTAEHGISLLGQHRTIAFDWPDGFIAACDADGLRMAPEHRALNTAALGMYVKGNCRQTIMNFAHKKLGRFMPVVSLPDPHMYLRSHNGFNDSRQKKVAAPDLTRADAAMCDLLTSRFAIDTDAVARAFMRLTNAAPGKT